MAFNFDDLQWLSVPETAQLLHLRQRDIRSMISDHRLVAIRRGENNSWAISTDQIVVKDGEHIALPSLRGTLIVLADAGYTPEESFNWLHTTNDELGATPMEAMREGRHRAVRRVALGMGF